MKKKELLDIVFDCTHYLQLGMRIINNDFMDYTSTVLEYCGYKATPFIIVEKTFVHALKINNGEL